MLFHTARRAAFAGINTYRVVVVVFSISTLSVEKRTALRRCVSGFPNKGKCKAVDSESDGNGKRRLVGTNPHVTIWIISELPAP
jgi:hypothetical protein